MRKRSKIYVLVGPSGCGKSTVAKNMAKLKNKIVVNRDQIREQLFSMNTVEYWNQKKEDIARKEKLVTDVEQAQISEAVCKKYDVIADNTHLHLRYIRKYLKHDATIEIVDCLSEFKEYSEMCTVDTLVDRVLKRDAHLGATHTKTKTLVRRQLDKYKMLMEHHKNDLEEIEDMSKVSDRDNRIIEHKERQRFYAEKGQKLPKAIICDLDGTLAIMGNRSPYNANECAKDLVNDTIHRLLKKYRSDGYRILLVSGRNSDNGGSLATCTWLRDNGIQHDGLWMRSPGDTRRDAVIKREFFENFIKDLYFVEMVLDDRNQTVQAWRDLGLPCFQVYPGNF